MKLTDYLAIWGAALSTILAGWSIYKDYLKRYRVRVEASFRVVYGGDGKRGANVFAVTVTNLSEHKIKVTHIATFEARVYRPRWINTLTYKLFNRSGQAYLFSFHPLHGDPLPLAIEPKDNHLFTYSVDEFPPIADLAVTTADGREWFLSRKSLRKILKDKTYLAIRERQKATAPQSRL
jgi:hypothetical protein